MKRMFRYFGRAFMALLFVSIIWNTVDIMLRRWWWEQIPSQISTPVVYGLLLANLMVIAYGLRVGLQKVRASKRRLSYTAIS